MGKSKSRKNITIKDVAAACGVSYQTVSRVINKAPNVKPALREKIERAIEELGYAPNLSARRMGGQRSYLIMAINDRARTIDNWRAGRGNDWVDQMLHGGLLACEEHGYRLVFELIDTEPPKAGRQLDAALSSLRPDGVILTPPHSANQDLVEILERHAIPFARIGAAKGGSGINVSMDDRAAAAEAVRHLVAFGHDKIAFVAGSEEYLVSQQRMDGFRDAMNEAGLPVPAAYLQPGDFSFDAGKAAGQALLELPDPPTAVIASNDEMAFGLLHIAAEMDVSVPDQLALISFDDTPGTRFTVPPLTAINQPIAAMVDKAATELIAAKGDPQARSDHVLPFALIARESTGRRQ